MSFGDTWPNVSTFSISFSVRTPVSAPNNEPRPPFMLTPPITVAAKTSKILPVPALADAEPRRPV